MRMKDNLQYELTKLAKEVAIFNSYVNDIVNDDEIDIDQILMSELNCAFNDVEEALDELFNAYLEHKNEQ